MPFGLGNGMAENRPKTVILANHGFPPACFCPDSFRKRLLEPNNMAQTKSIGCQISFVSYTGIIGLNKAATKPKIHVAQTFPQR